MKFKFLNTLLFSSFVLGFLSISQVSAQTTCTDFLDAFDGDLSPYDERISTADVTTSVTGGEYVIEKTTTTAAGSEFVELATNDSFSGDVIMETVVSGIVPAIDTNSATLVMSNSQTTRADIVYVGVRRGATTLDIISNMNVGGSSDTVVTTPISTTNPVTLRLIRDGSDVTVEYDVEGVTNVLTTWNFNSNDVYAWLGAVANHSDAFTITYSSLEVECVGQELGGTLPKTSSETEERYYYLLLGIVFIMIGIISYPLYDMASSTIFKQANHKVE